MLAEMFCIPGNNAQFLCIATRIDNCTLIHPSLIFLAYSAPSIKSEFSLFKKRNSQANETLSALLFD
jgi:hypothetical protein